MAGPSQYLQAKLLSQVFGATAYSAPGTLYIGVCTTANSSANLDATLLAAEPTSTGSYGRIVVTNNTTNFPAASGSDPATSKLHVAFAFATSTAAYSSGASALPTWFINDSPTLASGNVLWSGPLSPATDIVNGAGVALSFAIDALQQSLNQS